MRIVSQRLNRVSDERRQFPVRIPISDLLTWMCDPRKISEQDITSFVGARQMKTKYISTTYSDSYTLAPGYRAIDIEANGALDGGLTLTGANAVKVTNDGTVAGFGSAYAAGGDGLSLTGAAQLTGAGIISGGAGGYYTGDDHGAFGGDGVLLMSNSRLEITVTTIFGGLGGPGHHSANGGGGGAGVALMSDSKLMLTATTIVGGMGGRGEIASGGGGAGVLLSEGASLTATAGTITGGEGSEAERYGGSGGTGLTLYDAALKITDEMITGGGGGRGFVYGGVGGNGVALADATITITGDTITGGAGGAGGRRAGQSGNAGAGGNGIYLTNATLTVAEDTITGGAAGTGYGGFDPGEGGAGVLLGTDASLTTTGIITGGVGGRNPYHGSDGGAGVSLSTGASLMVKAGTITGGAGGYSYGYAYAGGGGGAGVHLTAGGSLRTTGGTITGGAGGASRSGVNGGMGDGVDINGGGMVINGDAANAGALISGVIGVFASSVGVATVTNFATIQGTGGTSVAFSNAGDRLIVEAGTTFVGTAKGGGGTLELAGGIGTITGLGASGDLTGAASLTFSGFGAYDFDTRDVLTLIGENSAASLTNAGSLTIANEASLQVEGAVDNDGVLETSGILTLIGAVSGTGKAVINAGTLGAGSAFTQDVTFSGTTGVLELADATAYTGTITSFSTVGGTSLDLRDVGFVSPNEATFHGSVNGGVLTVTDGANTAQIKLKGHYAASNFMAASDGHGGTIVVAQSNNRPAASVHAFISAMARFGSPAGQAVHTDVAREARQSLLSSPRAAIV